MLENRLRLIYLAEKLMVAETLEGQVLEKTFTEPIPQEEDQRAPAPGKNNATPPAVATECPNQPRNKYFRHCQSLPSGYLLRAFPTGGP